MNKRQEEQSIVIVIDDDDLVREAVCDLLRSIGLPTKPFASVPELVIRTF